MSSADARESAAGGASEETLALVKRAQAGDDAAWAELYRRYEPILRRRIQARMGRALRAQPEDSDDIVQSLWREAARNLRGFEYRGEGSLLAWLDRLARNKVASKAGHYDAAKRAGRAKDGSVADAALEALSGGIPGPSTEAAKREELELLRRALAQLPLEQREIIRLATAERLPQAEIGRRLGIGEDAARKRLARAEAALVKEFHRLGGKR